MQILQEDRTRQGVVGSQSGHETGPVSRKCPNGALYEPGFGRLSTPEKGRSGGWFSDVKYGDSVRCVGIDRGIFSGPEIFFKKKRFVLKNSGKIFLFRKIFPSGSSRKIFHCRKNPE